MPAAICEATANEVDAYCDLTVSAKLPNPNSTIPNMLKRGQDCASYLCDPTVEISNLLVFIFAGTKSKSAQVVLPNNRPQRRTFVLGLLFHSPSLVYVAEAQVLREWEKSYCRKACSWHITVLSSTNDTQLTR